MTDAAFTPPRLLREGRYVWRHHLRDGGMAGVHLYRDRQRGADVAIKLLDARLLGRFETGTERFIAEARALAQLRHPYVVPVFAAGCTEGFYWYAMEYCPAGTLRDSIKGKRGAPPQRVARWTFETLLGLQAVQASGILHRDIKPSNLLLALDGRVRIADFGIARHPRSNVKFRTVSGSGMGSHGYAAPELLENAKEADERADIHATAATVFQLMTGEPPGSLMFLDVDPSVLDPVPPEFRELIATGIATDPADRYPSARAMAFALVEATDAWATRTGAAVRARGWLSEWPSGLQTWLRSMARRLGLAAA